MTNALNLASSELNRKNLPIIVIFGEKKLSSLGIAIGSEASFVSGGGCGLTTGETVTFSSFFTKNQI